MKALAAPLPFLGIVEADEENHKLRRSYCVHLETTSGGNFERSVEKRGHATVAAGCGHCGSKVIGGHSHVISAQYDVALLPPTEMLIN